MYSQIKITGQVLKIIKKEYEGKESYQLQFMLNDPKKGFNVLSVKLEKEFFTSDIKDNVNVEVPVRVVSVNGVLYYSSTDKVKVLQK